MLTNKNICVILTRKGGNMTEAQKKASAKYQKNNTKMFTIKLNYNNDANLICYLESQSNIQGFIKQVLNEKLDEVTKEVLR